MGKGLDVPTFTLTSNGSIVFWSEKMEKLTKSTIVETKSPSTADLKQKSIFEVVAQKSEAKIHELLRKGDDYTISNNRRAERIFLMFKALGDDIPIPFHVFNVSSKRYQENPISLIFVHIGNEVNQDVNYFTEIAFAYSQSTK